MVIKVNDDIKEIFEALKESYDETIPKQEFERSLKYIEDCITNLQQENERLKALNKEYKYELGLNEFEHTTIIDTSYKEDYKDYKSRCEKAVEYNQQIIKDTKDFYRPTEDIIYSGDTLIDIAKQNINILNGRSDK